MGPNKVSLEKTLTNIRVLGAEEIKEEIKHSVINTLLLALPKEENLNSLLSSPLSVNNKLKLHEV